MLYVSLAHTKKYRKYNEYDYNSGKYFVTPIKNAEGKTEEICIHLVRFGCCNDYSAFVKAIGGGHPASLWPSGFLLGIGKSPDSIRKLINEMTFDVAYTLANNHEIMLRREEVRSLYLKLCDDDSEELKRWCYLEKCPKIYIAVKFDSNNDLMFVSQQTLGTQIVHDRVLNMNDYYSFYGIHVTDRKVLEDQSIKVVPILLSELINIMQRISSGNDKVSDLRLKYLDPASEDVKEMNINFKIRYDDPSPQKQKGGRKRTKPGQQQRNYSRQRLSYDSNDENVNNSNNNNYNCNYDEKTDTVTTNQNASKKNSASKNKRSKRNQNTSNNNNNKKTKSTRNNNNKKKRKEEDCIMFDLSGNCVTLLLMDCDGHEIGYITDGPNGFTADYLLDSAKDKLGLLHVRENLGTWFNLFSIFLIHV